MSVYSDDPVSFQQNLKETLKAQARKSRDNGDVVDAYIAQHSNLKQYIIEATCFDAAILKYLKIMKSDYNEDELSILLEEMSEACGDVPITQEMAYKWLHGMTRQPASPWSSTRVLKRVEKR